MTNQLKKIATWVFCGLATILLSSATYLLHLNAELLASVKENQEKVNLEFQNVGANTFSLAVRNTNNDNPATSTTLTIGPSNVNGSSSLAFFSDKADNVDLNFYIKASSSPSNLIVRREFARASSSKTQLSDPSVEWYMETCSEAVSNILVTFGAPCTLQIPMATNTLPTTLGSEYVKVNIPLNDLRMQMTKIWFSSSATATVFMEAVLRTPND